MKDFIKIAVAVLIMAVAVPMRAQEWSKVNDTTWHFNDKKWPTMETETTTYTAWSVEQLAAETARRNRQAGFMLIGSMGCAAASGCAAVFGNGNRTSLGFAIAFGIASVGLQVASAAVLIGPRVKVTPEGVVVRLSRVEKPRKPK